MRGRLALVSLSALAFAEAATAQPAIGVAPTEVRGAAQEGLSPQGGGAGAALQAPVATDIVADTGALSLGTTVTQNGNVHTIDGGTQAGANLFHSFGRFDLGQGDFARWVHSAGDPASIQNVVNRVTGGDPSRIFGTIDSTALPNANFFFINPAGIVFGDGAQVNVPAAAHFSTASELRFADGPAFTVATPSGSTFSVANPVAFGFVGTEGDILIQNSGLISGGALSFSAANVEVANSVLDANSLLLAGVGAAPAAVPLAGLPDTALAGNVTVADSFIRIRGSDGARVVGGTIGVERTQLIAEVDTGAAGALTLVSRDAILLRDATLYSGTTFVGPAAAGTISLSSGGDILIGDRTSIRSVSNGEGADASGDVLISAPRIRIGEGNPSNEPLISVEAIGLQPAGNIILTGEELAIANGAISSNSFAADAASISLRFSRSVQLDAALIASEALGRGSLVVSSGAIEIAAPLIRINDSRLTTSAFGSALAGSIDLAGVTIDLTGSSIVSNIDGLGCDGPCAEVGEAGRISIAAGTLNITRTEIAADTLAGGFGGEIFLLADAMAIRQSSVTSISNSAEDAGTIDLIGGSLLVEDSAISSQALGAGRGGRIFMLFDAITLAGPSRITSDAGQLCLGDGCPPPTAGDAGGILIQARRLDVLGTGPESTLITSNSYGDGRAGDIELITDSAFISAAAIRSTAFGSGDAGQVDIRGANLTLTDFATVDSSTFRGGNAGGVAILLTGSLALDGGASIRSDAEGGSTGAAGTVDIVAPEISLDNGSTISTNSFGSGRAGDILILAENMAMRNEASIVSTAFSEGDAGSVSIGVAGNLLVDGGSRIATNTETGSTGDAGQVLIGAGGRVTLSNFGNLSSTVNGSGNGGLVAVKADEILMSRGATITTDTFAICDTCADRVGGDILLDARAITLIAEEDMSFPFIASDTFGPGQAGSVTVRATEKLTLSGPAFIASDTYAEGNAGSVAIEAGAILLDGGKIRSSAQPGTGGNAGMVTLTGGDLIVRNEGEIATRTGEEATGDAGAVEVTMSGRILVEDEGTISSTSLGSGAAGTVDLTAAAVTVDTAGSVTSSAGAEASAAGTVAINAADVLIDRGGFVSTGTAGAGPAGQVFINAPGSLRVDRGASVSSNTSGAGAGGGVLITAGSVEVARQAEIASRTEEGENSTGNAGGVLIQASSLLVRDGGSVNSRTVSQGNAGNVALSVRDIVVTDRGNISSSTVGSGNAGTVGIAGETLRVDAQGRISSTSTGSGAAGDVAVIASRVVMDSAGAIESNAGPDARKAGTVTVAAETLVMANGAIISTSTLGQGAAGEIEIAVTDLSLDSGARIASNTGGQCDAPCVQTGNAGQIGIVASGTVSLRGGAEISSNSNTGSGDAGQVVIKADRLLLAGGRVSTSTSAQSSGESGVIAIQARELAIDGAGSIETISRNDKPAGVIAVSAETIALNGPLARITSSNEGETGGAAGAILIEAGDLKLLEGAQINTTSRTGAAGDILISMPDTAFLRLESSGVPSKIDTSSGPGTGGRILINAPYSIISNGGSILALGQSGGANVEIVTRYFISSADRTNLVAVSGDFLLEAIAYDVSAGTVNRDLSVIDASGVLRGQCAAVRQTGQVSQLVVRPIGPYGTRPIGAVTIEPPRELTGLQLLESCG